MGSGKPFTFAEPHSNTKRKHSDSLAKSIDLLDVPPAVFPRGYPDRHYLRRHAMPYAQKPSIPHSPDSEKAQGFIKPFTPADGIETKLIVHGQIHQLLQQLVAPLDHHEIDPIVGP